MLMMRPDAADSPSGVSDFGCVETKGSQACDGKPGLKRRVLNV